jgi:hypothetical protein
MASGPLQAIAGQQPTANPKHHAEAEFLNVLPAIASLHAP